MDQTNQSNTQPGAAAAPAGAAPMGAAPVMPDTQAAAPSTDTAAPVTSDAASQPAAPSLPPLPSEMLSQDAPATTQALPTDAASPAAPSTDPAAATPPHHEGKGGGKAIIIGVVLFAVGLLGVVTYLGLSASKSQSAAPVAVSNQPIPTAEPSAMPTPTVSAVNEDPGDVTQDLNSIDQDLQQL